MADHSVLAVTAAIAVARVRVMASLEGWLAEAGLEGNYSLKGPALDRRIMLQFTGAG